MKGVKPATVIAAYVSSLFVKRHKRKTCTKKMPFDDFYLQLYSDFKVNTNFCGAKLLITYI